VPVEGLRGGDGLHLGSEIAGAEADGAGWLAGWLRSRSAAGGGGGWSRIGRGWEQGPREMEGHHTRSDPEGGFLLRGGGGMFGLD
jgi:hypothetical protein